MLKARYFKHTLKFKKPGGTSRGILVTKDSWFIKLWHTDNLNFAGIGECSIIEGLSIDAVPEFELVLQELCESIHLLPITNNRFDLNFLKWPAIAFGLQLALWDLHDKGRKTFEAQFQKAGAIPINGLIWMGDKVSMKAQINACISAGFTCIKLKIGAINFSDELNLLKFMRKEFRLSDLEIRVDANGAFSTNEAMEKIKRLSEYQLHSIEQPIKAGLYSEMAQLCLKSPIDIALDEELIGPFDKTTKQQILQEIKPQYIVVKPSLHSGFHGAEDWIEIAESLGVGWWVTSALESNIGLNGIARWVNKYDNLLPQGLGTGSLYSNNIDSPLFVSNGQLCYSKEDQWDLTLFK